MSVTMLGGMQFAGGVGTVNPPSLSLDFLSTTSLNSQVTFSRGSHAIVTDATGKLTYAPNNLLPNSESFENSTWMKTNITVTSNTVAAPDGTLTADTITATATSGQHTVESASVIVVGTTYVASVYVKANGSRYFTITNQGSTSYGACFDLQTGTLAIPAGANITATNITSVSGGWYRVSVASAFGFGRISFAVNNSASNGFVTYAGDGTSGIYLWGAQLEAVTYQTTPSPYVSTTPKNLLGYTQEFDNAAWTKSNATAYPFDPATATQGPELVTNGDFSGGTTGWTLGSGWSVSGGVASFSSATGAALSTSVSLTAGRTYLVSFDMVQGSGHGVTGGFSGGGGSDAFPTRNSTGLQSFYVTASINRTTLFFTGIGGSTFSIDNISVKELSSGLITAPDGSLTADKLVETTANGNHGTYISSVVSANVTVCVSLYVKPDGRNLRVTAYTASNGLRANFNFSTMTVTNGSYGNSTYISGTIVPVGGGWYRVVLIGIPSSTETNPIVDFALLNGATSFYTGDGTSGIYLWGAQLSNSASVDPYVYNPVAAPSSTAYYGPRFDYDPVTLAPRGLLIEGQRTNLLVRSEEFDDASWSKINCTVTQNLSVSPDGTADADKLVEDSSTASHLVVQGFTGTAVPHTLTVYAKAGERSQIRMRLYDGASFVQSTYFDIAAGTVVSGIGNIISAGNGWWRCSIAGTLAASAGCSAQIILAVSGSDSYTGDGTSGIYIWGAQLEAGSFATSYIPTVASQVTRTADVAAITGANFSQWYNQSEGTFVVGASTIRPTSVSAVNFAAIASDGTSNERTQIAFDITQVTAATFDGGVSQALLTASYTTNSVAKAAFAYAANNFAASFNGAAATTDTSGTLPTVDRLTLGSNWAASNFFLNGHIRSIQYYPTRLNNQTIQLLSIT